MTVEVGNLPETGGFYVGDDGASIPADERDRAFDEGYTTASDSGGTVPGLVFVAKLAEVYDWDIRVTEDGAGGARFEFHGVA